MEDCQGPDCLTEVSWPGPGWAGWELQDRTRITNGPSWPVTQLWRHGGKSGLEFSRLEPSLATITDISPLHLHLHQRNWALTEINLLTLSFSHLGNSEGKNRKTHLLTSVGKGQANLSLTFDIKLSFNISECSDQEQCVRSDPEGNIT